MAINWAEEAEEVRLALDEDGQPVKIRVPAATGYDPDLDDDPVPGTATDHDASGIVLDFDTMQAGQAFAGGTLILAGDRRAYISVPDVAPAPGHLLVESAGAVWNVRGVKALAPAGVPVLYELLLRK